MRSRPTIVIVAAFLFVAGCDREPSMLDQVNAAGGTAAVISECETIWANHEKTRETVVWAEGLDTNLPPTIAALRPHIIQAFRYEGLPRVYIQLQDSIRNGRLVHRGLIVILTNVPPDFVPRSSDSKVRKIAESIFEYHD
jgi:hypothetical protein